MKCLALPSNKGLWQLFYYIQVLQQSRKKLDQHFYYIDLYIMYI